MYLSIAMINPVLTVTLLCLPPNSMLKRTVLHLLNFYNLLMIYNTIFLSFTSDTCLMDYLF